MAADTHLAGADQATLPDATRIGRVHLRVADLERSLRFYRDQLGLIEFERAEQTAELGPRDGRPLIVLNAQSGTRQRPPGIVGLYHYALLYPNRRELGRVLLHLFEARYPFQGFADHAVSEAAYLADPDGNGIELYADRPRDDWQRDEQGQIVMGTFTLNVNSLLRTVDGEEWTGTAADTRVGHVHLHVSALDRAGDFYHNVIGFEVTNQGYPGALFMAAGGYHHHLGLNTWLKSTHKPADIADLQSYEIVLPDRRAIGDVLERARAGQHVVDDVDGNAAVIDPDGMRVVLTT